MSHATRVTFLATEHAHVGRVYIEQPCPGVVAATTPGDASVRTKVTPNEDSLAVVALAHGGIAALVADAHFGPWAGEIVADAFAAHASESPRADALDGAALARTLAACDAAVHARRQRGDRSETTALAVALAGTRLAWANVGDSLLLVARDGAAPFALTRTAHAFLGGATRYVAADDGGRGTVIDRGEFELAPGDIVLLATDGLEPEASGLMPDAVAAILRAPGTLESRIADVIARGGFAAHGGGRDNLTLVALEMPA